METLIKRQLDWVLVDIKNVLIVLEKMVKILESLDIRMEEEKELKKEDEAFIER